MNAPHANDADFTLDLLAIELQNYGAHAGETFDKAADLYPTREDTAAGFPANVAGLLNFTMLRAERASLLCSVEYERRMALTGF